MSRLRGKIAIITGAARGQGAEHARHFVREGANVVLGDVLLDEVAAVANEIGHSAIYCRLDVTDIDSWSEALALCVSTFGQPQILVNNAGVLGEGNLVDVGIDEFRRTMDINLLGPWLGIKVIGSSMASAPTTGSIVNVASIAGHRAAPGLGSYTASKWALRGLTRAAALELGSAGIRVNAILPGYIDTPMLAGRREALTSYPGAFSKLALARMGESSEISSMVVFLGSDESAYCTGADFVVDGGASLGYFVPTVARS